MVVGLLMMVAGCLMMVVDLFGGCDLDIDLARVLVILGFVAVEREIGNE